MKPCATASAPGKLILFGEHAVVYGNTAIAASLSDLRIYVYVDALLDHGKIQLHFDDIVSSTDQCPLYREWSVEEIKVGLNLPWDLADCLPKPKTCIIEQLTQFLSTEASFDKKALMPLLFLICCISNFFANEKCSNTKGLKIRTSSKSLPLGAGLGSSAALCVATATALLYVYDTLTDEASWNVVENSKEPSSEAKRVINDYAYASEVLLHGNPSGVDNTISTYGGAISFIREPLQINFFHDFPALKILLTNTCVPRETSHLVQHVKQVYQKFPSVTVAVFAAIQGIAQHALDILNCKEITAANKMKIGELIRMNQSLLESLGVSHLAIDKISYITTKHQMYSKLTGAGGGGCTMSLLLDDDWNENVHQAIEELEKEGFICFDSNIGGSGVLLH